jgi:hypothetical protein
MGCPFGTRHAVSPTLPSLAQREREIPVEALCLDSAIEVTCHLGSGRSFS